MSKPNNKLFRDDPATYYVELGAKSERERIIKLLEAQAKRSSSEEYRRAFLQLIADLPYTVEEIHGEAEQ